MSPAAAWIAIAGSLDARMLILCAAVTLWVGGFDVLYACQDIEYDKSVELFSVPKRFGIARALAIARAMHVVMIALLAWLAWSFHLPWPAWAGIAVVAGAARLSSIRSFPERLEPDECCVFHGERLY